MKSVRFLCRAALFTALVLIAVPAFAQEAKDSKETDGPAAGPNCDVAGYKSERVTFDPPFPIVDNTDTDALVGSGLFMPADGDIINDVILEITWNHTWVGDIILTLGYDADCTGPLPEVATRVLCRPRGTNASGPVPCGVGPTTIGCGSNIGTSANLPATYFFSDEAPGPIAEGVCPTLTPAGCYKPATGGAFADFRGLYKGGCWRLRIADWAAGDVGTIVSWAVHVRNQHPVPVTAASWGLVKSVYR
jgi:hypothetical protein